MTRVVLDASALLALLLGEPGAAAVEAALDDACMCTVNHAEVVGHYAKLGAARGDVEALLRPLPITMVPLDTGLAFAVGMMLPITQARGLSLGDRSCLALARRERAVALTAERRWPEIAEAVGVVVQLIR